MTQVECTKCHETFDKPNVKEFDLLECPFCGEPGYYSKFNDQKFVTGGCI